MSRSRVQAGGLFEVEASEYVSATPDEVYATVSDLPRSGEWSTECTGGRWVSGEPSAVGSVFRGENFRSADAVGWAPVVRGDWSTEAEIVEAIPGRVFRWAMRNKAGYPQDSVWSFEIRPDQDGSVLTHAFRMGSATEGIQGITAEMDEPTRNRFLDEWGNKLEGDIAATVGRIRAVVEKESR